ncbi:MAG: vWA domain-containing protein [bacterium]
MKKLLVLLVAMIFAVSCGNSTTEKDKSKGLDESVGGYGESYGDDVIGYRNSGDKSAENSEDAGCGYCDSGDSGDSGEMSDYESGSSEISDDIGEMPDDDNEMSSELVKKNSNWSDWVGIFISGEINDLTDDPLNAEELFLDGKLSGDRLFAEKNYHGYMMKEGSNFVSVATSLIKSENVFDEYLHYYSFLPFENIKSTLAQDGVKEGFPAFVFSTVEEDAKLRKECVLGVTMECAESGACTSQFSGNTKFDADKYELYPGDNLKFNMNVELTTNDTKLIEAANSIRDTGEADFIDTCICYDSEGSIMECTALDEEMGKRNLALMNENKKVFENPFFTSADRPAISFGLDVDSASYTVIRASLNNGSLPEPESVRIEEMINYFKYHYKKPEPDKPFTLYSELGMCPWNLKRKMVMLGVRGSEVEFADVPPANIVYLIDVSGSMADDIGLIKKALRMLVPQMREQDVVSIVTYAGNASLLVDGISGNEKEALYEAIDGLKAGGATYGEGGIVKAYEIAEKHFIEGGSNRVILATDGDFNVGVSSNEELVALIKEKKETGVFLSVYGFGYGNYQDKKMEELSNAGNGTYFYIDSAQEAKRAFANAFTGSMLAIAKDVKLQVQFNPKHVKGFRLIGYDNRVMSNDDFDNDKVGGGVLGNGQDMTAFLEIIPAVSNEDVPPIPEGEDVNEGDETEFEPLPDDVFVVVRIRYKDPDSDESMLIENVLKKEDIRQIPSVKYYFAAAVAELGLLLRHSVYFEERSIGKIIENVKLALKNDPEGAVKDFLEMVEKAHGLNK